MFARVVSPLGTGGLRRLGATLPNHPPNKTPSSRAIGRVASRALSTGSQGQGGGNTGLVSEHPNFSEADVNAVGSTAFMVNEVRAMELSAEKPLYLDPYSGTFSTEFFRNMAAHVMEKFSMEGIWTIPMACRTASIDEALQHFIHARHGRQVVTLGSGLDCRAARLFHREVTFVEIDQPGVLQFKKRVLDEHGLSLPSVTVEANYLELPSLTETLKGAGLDPELPTFFIWEGNAVYLPTAANTALLEHISQNFPTADVMFDVMSNKVSNPEGEIRVGSQLAKDMIQELMNYTSQGKHIWQGSVDVDAVCESQGWTALAHDNFLDLHDEMCPGRMEPGEMTPILAEYTLTHLAKGFDS